MEFWGVEVKAGQPLQVTPDPEKVIHISQAALGESKKEKGSVSVPLFVKVGNQKIVLGTLSAENIPQISLDLVFEKEFELSHNWKNGSIYVCGYTTIIPDEYPSELDSDSYSEEELPLVPVENGKAAVKGDNAKPAPAKANATKPKVNVPEPEGDDSDEDMDDDDEDEEDDSDEESDDESSEEDSEEDEETPKKVEVSKKRPNDSAIKTPVASKKAKAETPQKTDGKKGGHTATPYPSKQAGKTSATGDKSKSKSPKSGGQVLCQPCGKSFNSEAALQSHSKAKHGGK